MNVGVVGFGAFGRFMAGHLARALHGQGEVVACDRAEIEHVPAGLRAGTIARAAASDVVIVAVPVQEMGPVLAEISRHVRPGALVADVASVKLRPIEMMRAALPGDVEILGTHPLFGPESGKDGIAGLPIAVCPVRISRERLERVREFLAGELGLVVHEVEAERHDREMAYVQGLTHALSRAMARMPMPETPLATLAYQRLMAMRSNLAKDSLALFVTIARENPYAGAARAELREALAEVERLIDVENREGESR
jgi:prephenate dehydrogenase